MSHELIPYDPIAFREPGYDLDLQRPAPAWVVDADGRVMLRCRCGLLIGSPTNHSIDADGTVNASVLHTPEPEQDHRLQGRTCDWHTFVRLGDWTDGAQARGAPKIAASKRRG